MRFPLLVEGQLIRRYKRFLADVLLDSGETVVAHCANPGSMRSLLEPLPRVWLSRARPERKLAYTWEVADYGDSQVYVNPQRANQVVAEGILQRRFPELADYEVLFPESTYRSGTRFDFLLSGPLGSTYVEVKSATMSFGEGRAAFPDSVTKRGQKHLQELSHARKNGHRAILFFCVGRSDAVSVEPAVDIDQEYARLLSNVHKQGVELIAYAGTITKQGFTLDRKVPVLLPARSLLL